MMRLGYYTQIALLDLWRLRRMVLPQIAVVAGICLPILLLLGLKRGHVDGLRHDLLTSATGRQILFWSHTEQAKPLTRSVLENVPRELSRVDLVIPEIQHHVALTSQAADGTSSRSVNATLYTTKRGDPLLKLEECDVLKDGERGIVLLNALAQELGVRIGDAVTMTVRRRQETKVASVRLTVMAIKPKPLDGEPDEKVGFLDATLHDWVEQYLVGFRVAELQWPAAATWASDAYAGYFLFCRPGDDLRKEDRDYLGENHLEVEEVTDEERRTLYGLLRPNTLSVYFLHTQRSHTDPALRLPLSSKDARKLMEYTAPDDAIVRWNDPVIVRVGRESWRIVGCSLPPDTWLWTHLASAEHAFPEDAERLSVRFLAPPLAPAGTAARVEIDTASGGTVTVPVNGLVASGTRPELAAQVVLQMLAGRGVAPAAAPLLWLVQGAIGMSVIGTDPLVPGDRASSSSGTSSRPPTAVVPVELLAHFDGTRNGKAEFDPIIQRFVPVAHELRNKRARLYATTIDDVPAVVEQLRARKYDTVSEYSRIQEIRKQDASLVSLVWIVGGVVTLFGIFTCTCILLDSTARKCGAIGILRVMGVSRGVIFYVVVLRAAVIGLVAGILTVSVGLVAAWVLGYATIAVTVVPLDLSLVFGCALACCVGGSLYPARSASKVNPFDAIVEGKFR